MTTATRTDHYAARSDSTTNGKVEQTDERSVFDLDRVIAEREDLAPFKFKFAGDTYTLPSRPDVRAAAALSAGRLDDGLRMLLGDDQWARMQSADATFDDRDLLAVLEAYQAHTGESLGESKASAR